MANRNFNARQALEREVKDLYCQINPGTVGVASEATIDVGTDIVLTSVAVTADRNDTTFELVVNAAAANPTDTVLADFTGDADAIVCTITPNDGTNNPGDAAEATLDLSTDIVLTSVAAGTPRNGETFELVVNAAAANPLATVIVAFTGTAAAIVCTVTPNDGTNNGAVPVSLDEDELAELINTGAVVGKTITLTDASSLRILQTAAGGAAADALTAGDDQVVAFAAGTDVAVDLSTEELVELINTGVVVGKTVTVTDASSLRALQTAAGGDTDALTAADDQEVTFADGVTAIDPSFASAATSVGFASVSRTDVGEYTLVLQDAYASLKSADAILLWSTAADVQFQLQAESVSTKSVVVQALTSASAVDVDPAARIVVKLELKNTAS